MREAAHMICAASGEGWEEIVGAGAGAGSMITPRRPLPFGATMVVVNDGELVYCDVRSIRVANTFLSDWFGRGVMSVRGRCAGTVTGEHHTVSLLLWDVFIL